MKYTPKFIYFMLFVLMACGDEGGPASGGRAESMAMFSRLRADFENFMRIQESAQFATPGSGFTFESNASCGSAFIEIDADFSYLTSVDLISRECIEFSLDGEDYFYILNGAPLDDDLWVNLQLVFYGGRPINGEYDLNCLTSVCDGFNLVLRITDSEGYQLARYYVIPDALNVRVLSNSVSASFGGRFYSDPFEDDEYFHVAGTLVCCQ